MEDAAQSTEQQQLLVEIHAVTANIGKQGSPQGDPGKASYEIEQGRKLIEKAVSLGLPEQSYAELRDRLAAHDGSSGA